MIKDEGVILIPQWHLGSGPIPSEHPPQEANQLAIYTQLSTWVEGHTIDSLLAEGCEGPIENQTSVKINGWSVDDLTGELSQKHNIDSLLAPIAYKIKAKYKNNLVVACGDREQLIHDNLLALSNLRGFAGFKMRLEDPQLSPQDRESYLNKAAEVLRLPRDSSLKFVLENLNSEISKSLDQFENLLQQRNDNFVLQLEQLKGIKVLVIGALHLHGLEAQLTKKKIPYSIWTPIGLEDQENRLIEQLKSKLLKTKSHI